MKNPGLFLICLLSILIQGGLRAAVPQLSPDRSVVVVRRPDQAQLERFRTNRDYQYGSDVQPPEGLLARLWSRFINWLLDWLYNPGYKNTRDWLTVLFVVGIGVFVVFRLLGMNTAGLLGRRNARFEVPYALETENIHGLDFGAQLAEALDRRQYRLAVRLHYLQTLKHLTDAGLIDWQPNKTNRTYTVELSTQALRPDFEALTRQFESVWYGDFPLDAPHYESLRQQFEQFEQRLLPTARKPF